MDFPNTVDGHMVRCVGQCFAAFGAIDVDPSVIGLADGNSLSGSLRDLSSFKEYSLATIALGLQYLSISNNK